MKITILKKNLRDGLMIIEHATSDSNQLPILKTVLLKAQGDALHLSATNLEIGIQTVVSGKVVDEGGVAVLFGTLHSIISNLTSERIELEVKNQQLFITTENYSAKIQGFPESDFPIIPKLNIVRAKICITSNLLRNALLEVAVAAQLSEIRPELGGVLFDYQLTILHLVATDSFRLAEKIITDQQMTINTKEIFKVIVPLKTIQEIIRIFSQQGEITIAIDEHQILIKNDAIELVSRIIDGDYPDYEAVIPKTFETELSLEKEYLTQALKLVSSFSSKINDIHFRLNHNQNSLELYSSNQSVGENTFLIPVKIKGKPFTDIVFNWRYVLDGARAITHNAIVLSLNGEAKPGLLSSPQDVSYKYVVMPIRTQ